jgi:ABC-type glycerol-3-phosphate transport system permease component
VPGISGDLKALPRTIIILTVVILAAAVFLFPLAWMLLTSLRPRADIYKEVPTIIPEAFNLDNYRYILSQRNFLRFFLNSVVVTSAAVSIVLFSSLMGGYAFGMRRFRGQNMLFYLVTLVLAVPYIMYLVPIFVMEMYLDLRNTWLGLILPYVALNLPWGLLIMRGAFSTIPLDLKDSATIDGASEMRFVFAISTPILKPALAATTIITFVFVWEEFLFASSINVRNYTLPVYFKFLLVETQGQEWGKVGAVVVVTILPVLILFLIFRNFFIKGLSEGMLKG